MRTLGIKLSLVFSWLVVGVWGQVFVINFDDVTKWTAGSGGITSYQIDHEYNDQSWLFTGGPALRNTTAAQDGFPGALGTYSWRLRDAAGVSWTATFNGTADISSFGFDVRRWDGSPSPNYTIEYSINGGTDFTTVATINNTFLNNSSDWFSFSQTITPVSVVPGDFIVKVTRNGGERIMIDNFMWTIPTVLPEPTNHPINLGCSTLSISEINLTWTDATGGQEPDGYLIKWSDVSYAAITDPTDGSTANGPNSTTVAQGVETVAISGLSENTNYFFKIYPYTNSGANIDYKTNGAIEQTDCLTDEAPCANESFDNIPTGSANTYLTRTWVGDDGFEFTTTDSRTDQSISGQSVTIRNGSFTGYGITGGIGELTMSTRRDFAGGTGNLTITINGVDLGTVPYDATVQTTTIPNIDVAGTFDIVISTPGNGDRITIDDLSWTCYSSTNTLSISSLSSTTYNFNCLDPATGSIEFSSTGIFDTGNTIYVQLSDINGDFENPLIIGSLTTTDAFGTIPFSIPNGTDLGVNYRIRLFSTEPGILSLDNGTNLTLSEISCGITVTAVSSLSFAVDCTNPAAGSVDFSATGVYNSGNTFTVELSDAFGSFAAPIVIGSLSGALAEGADPSETIAFDIPAVMPSGTGYRIRLISSNPVQISGDNGADISITLSGNCTPPHITSLIINSCDDICSEGDNELFFGKTGDYSMDFTADNTNVFYGSDPSPTTNFTTSVHDLPLTTDEFNTNAGCPGLFVDAYNQEVPPNSSFIIAHRDVCPLDVLDFTNLCGSGPIYVVYVDASSWQSAGNFANSTTCSGGFRYLQSQFVTTINSEHSIDFYYECALNTGNTGDFAVWDEDGGAALLQDNEGCAFPPSVLPISLLDFTAKYNGINTELNWQTASEQDNDYFTLSHSLDGKNFTRIAMIPGSGNTDFEINYNYTHINTPTGINYFKLRSVDYDGTIHEKGIVAVVVEMEYVFYNRLTGQIFFPNTEKSYSVYDLTGRQVLKSQYQDKVNFSNKGIYLVVDEWTGKATKIFVD